MVPTKTPNEIQFDKSKYHLRREMKQWCLDNIGKGMHKQPNCLWLNADIAWVVDEHLFGRTSFGFKEDKHRIWFLLRWA